MDNSLVFTDGLFIRIDGHHVMGYGYMAMNTTPFSKRENIKRDEFAWTYACDGCGKIYLYPEDFRRVDGKILCGNCIKEMGRTS